MTVQSNASTAGARATEIQSGANGITAVGAPTKDDTSDYVGNSHASSYIDNEASYSNQISGKIAEFIGLIHSTSSAFVAMDQKLNQEIASNTQISLKASDSPVLYKSDLKPKYFDR